MSGADANSAAADSSADGGRDAGDGGRDEEDCGHVRCASLYCALHTAVSGYECALRCRLPEQRQGLDIGVQRCQMHLGSLRSPQWQPVMGWMVLLDGERAFDERTLHLAS